jgi:hypothetical protein
MDDRGRIVFSYDPQTRVRTSTFIGRIDDATLVEAYRALLADPGYIRGANDLVDLREANAEGLSAVVIPALVGMFAAHDATGTGLRSRTAIVAVSPLNFGLARMFQTLRGNSPDQVRVFRDYEEARHWLTT